MISRDSGKGFAAEHWDWLVALLGVAALAAVVAFKFVLAGDPTETDGAGAPRAKKAEVAKIDVDAVRAAASGAFESVVVQDVPGDDASFLASGLRVFCSKGDPEELRPSCGLPIPYGLDKCPYCGVTQKIDEAPSFDTDNDGLPDEWEKKYGLDPNDPADAQGDLDGDGFTNIEEFEAGTDPSDPASHPDYLDSLRIELPLLQTYTPLVFTGANQTPSGLKMAFTDPRRSADYDRGRYSVYAGEEIGKSGFVAREYVQKSRKVKMGGGMERSEDVSEAVVERQSDKKRVNLALNVRKTPTDVQAKLVYDRGGTREFLVVPGQTFSINEMEYRVVSIDKRGKGAKVAVESVKDGKSKTLEALEQ